MLIGWGRGSDAHRMGGGAVMLIGWGRGSDAHRMGEGQ